MTIYMKTKMQQTKVHQKKPRAGTAACQALVEELHRQASALAAMPEQLLSILERHGRGDLAAELRRQTRDLEAMSVRLGSKAA
jgi:hypothetical protein